LTEAKNHALVMSDAVIERAAQGIINSFCGCAGQRCMALPVVVIENSIADKVVESVVRLAKEVNLGPAYDKNTGQGPMVNQDQKDFVLGWIKTAIDEGAKLVLDGRNPKVPQRCEKGYFIGPTIFDHVTEDMSCGREEIFGPVLCIKRVDSFEEGLQIMNNSRFANGSAIYTESGHFAREFAKRSDAGMVGVNVGIPVPLGIFGFTGHKQSFFGDLHCMGRDAFIFYTETKNVTSTWFTGKEVPAKVSTWDGTMTRGGASRTFVSFGVEQNTRATKETKGRHKEFLSMTTATANPTMTGQEIVDLTRKHTLFEWSAQSKVDPIPVARAKGIYFWTPEGKRFIDFNSQLMSVNIGHGDERVIQAITDQASVLCYANPFMATEPRARLGAKLAQITPGDIDTFFFTNGGAEATENAIKLARFFTGRHKIIARYRSYHGATAGAISLTGDPRRWSIEPGMPGVVRVLDPYHGIERGWESAESSLALIEETIQLEGPHTIAGFILETVTGTNGILIPPDGYIEGVRKLCDKYGILMIADEVMSGFGRTGKWFAI